MPVKDEVKNYLTKLATMYGLDAAALLAKAEADAEAAKLIDEGVMLRSDYSRNLNELPDKIKAAKQEYYQKEVLPQWTQREQLLQTLQSENSTAKAKAAAYQALYGDLEGFRPTETKVETIPGNGWDPKKYEADVALTREIAALSGQEASHVGLVHYARFGEVLDRHAFGKFIKEKGFLNGATVDTAPEAFERAYEAFVEPQMKVKREAEMNAEIDRRVQEKFAAEAAKRTDAPFDTTQPGYRQSVFFKQQDAPDARLADANTPSQVKEDILRRDFMKDMGNTQLTSAIFAGG
jgi:hypothetical protein